MVCVASGKGINGCQETDENRGECRDIMADRKIEIDLEYKGLESCLEGIGADFQGSAPVGICGGQAAVLPFCLRDGGTA